MTEEGLVYAERRMALVVFGVLTVVFRSARCSSSSR